MKKRDKENGLDRIDIHDFRVGIAKNAGETFVREFSIQELFLLEGAIHMMQYWLSSNFCHLRNESEEFGAAMREWCKGCFVEMGFTEYQAEWMDTAAMDRSQWFKDARGITESRFAVSS